VGAGVRAGLRRFGAESRTRVRVRARLRTRARGRLRLRTRARGRTRARARARARARGGGPGAPGLTVAGGRTAGRRGGRARWRAARPEASRRRRRPRAPRSRALGAVLARRLGESRETRVIATARPWLAAKRGRSRLSRAGRGRTRARAGRSGPRDDLPARQPLSHLGPASPQLAARRLSAGRARDRRRLRARNRRRRRARTRRRARARGGAVYLQPRGRTCCLYWPSQLPGGSYSQTQTSRPLHCDLPQPSEVVPRHTTCVKWPVCIENPGCANE